MKHLSQNLPARLLLRSLQLTQRDAPMQLWQKPFFFFVILKIDKKFIESFTVEEVKEYLHLFSDSEFTYDLDQSKADERMRQLANKLKLKTTNVHINKALDLIIKFPRNPLHRICTSSSFKDVLKYI